MFLPLQIITYDYSQDFFFINRDQFKTIKVIANIDDFYNTNFYNLTFLHIKQHLPFSETTKLWNSLPDNVILADNVNHFKNRLDKHWKMHDIVFNYRADFAETVGRLVVARVSLCVLA